MLAIENFNHSFQQGETVTDGAGKPRTSIHFKRTILIRKNARLFHCKDSWLDAKPKILVELSAASPVRHNANEKGRTPASGQIHIEKAVAQGWTSEQAWAENPRKTDPRLTACWERLFVLIADEADGNSTDLT